MELPISGQSITRVVFDYAVTLLTDGGAELRLETAFELMPLDRAPALVEPSDASVFAAAQIGLLHREIGTIDVSDTGVLQIRVARGPVISVSPHDEFEAWSFTGSKNERAVCMPGGGVTSWGLAYLWSGSTTNLERSFLPGRTFDSPAVFDAQPELWLGRTNNRHHRRSPSSRFDRARSPPNAVCPPPAPDC